MRMYTTFEAAKILKVNRLAFLEWIKQGFVNPDVPANGAGTKARFKIETIYEARAMQCLMRMGIKRSEAAEYSRIGYWTAPHGFGTLIVKETPPVIILLDTKEVVRFVDHFAAKL